MGATLYLTGYICTKWHMHCKTALSISWGVSLLPASTTASIDVVSDLDCHKGKPELNTYCVFPIPTLQRGSVTPWSKSHHQSAYPLSLALVLIYGYWHAISCSITFTCQAVYQGGSTVTGGNSIRITFHPHRLIYLHEAGDSEWAKDITPGVSVCCQVSALNVCASLWDV